MSENQKRTLKVIAGWAALMLLSGIGLLAWEFYSTTLPGNATISETMWVLWASQPGAFFLVGVAVTLILGVLFGHFFWQSGSVYEAIRQDNIRRKEAGYSLPGVTFALAGALVMALAAPKCNVKPEDICKVRPDLCTVASPSPAATPTPLPSPSASASPSPAPEPSATPAPTPSPSPVAQPSPTPAPTVPPSPTPAPTAPPSPSCAPPVELPAQPVRVKNNGACPKGFERLILPAGPGCVAKSACSKSRCFPGDPEIAGAKVDCAPAIWILNSQVSGGHKPGVYDGDGYVDQADMQGNNPHGSIDAYGRRVLNGHLAYPPNSPDGWEYSDMCMPEVVRPCSNPSPAPTPSPSGTPGPIPNPHATPADCPQMTNWGGTLYHVQNGGQSLPNSQVSCTGGGRNGGRQICSVNGAVGGKLTIDSTEHFGGPACDGSHETDPCGGRDCQDHRGPVWSFSGADCTPNGDFSFQLECRNLQAGTFTWELCPRPDLQDFAKKPVPHNSTCASGEVEIR